MIGLVQGGVQALSRSFFSSMVPEGRSAQYFSFFNLLGKFAAVIGPFAVGKVSLMTGSNRAGILPLALLFLLGMILLQRTAVREGSLSTSR